MSKVIISMDSPGDIPPFLAKEYNIQLCPLHVIVDGADHLDGIDITPDEILDTYNEKKILPSTSAIPVGEYIDKFAAFTADGSKVVHIGLSSGISSSYRNACIAAEDFDGVYVIDSQLLCSAMAIVAIKAAKMAQAGVEAAEIAAAVTEMVKKSEITFVLDNLEFLAKGGRCSAVAALGANLLGLRPALEMQEGGKLGVYKKYRGKIEKVQAQYIAERLEEIGECDDDLCFVVHSRMDKAQVDEMIKLVQASGKFKAVYEADAGCTITAHCGPNCLALVVLKK